MSFHLSVSSSPSTNVLPLFCRRFDDTLPLDQCLRALSSDDDADADWPTLSPDFQATIPALRPRPAQPSRSEAKFLQAVQVYPPTQGTPAALLPNVSTDISPCCPQDFHAVYMATIPRDRAQLLADTVQALDAKLGPNLVKVRQPHAPYQSTTTCQCHNTLLPGQCRTPVPR